MIALVMAAGAAVAAPPHSVSELVVTASKTLSELVVPAPMACLKPDPAGGTPLTTPKVVSTFPKKGSTVRPGLMVLRVTFDQPMSCYGAFAEDNDWSFPCDSVQNMVLSYDRRTVRTVCLTKPNTHYGLWMDRRPGSGDFLSLAGRAPKPYELAFSTSAEPPVTSVCQALAQDTEAAQALRLDCAGARSGDR